MNMDFLVCFLVILDAVSVISQGQDIVAFSKGLAHHQLYTSGDVITYDREITNYNSNFSSDGKFVAPVNGIYTFHYHTVSRSGSDVWLSFYKNGHYLTSVFAYMENSFADSGNSMLLRLAAGDKVYVKAHNDYDSNLYGNQNEIYSTFTGVLLIPEPTGTSKSVAFTAGLTHTVTLTGNHRSVVFDKIFTNIGNGYHISSGAFVAPQDGYYLFHYYAMSDVGKELYLDLYANGRYINSIYGEASHSYVDGGNSAILDLRRGDNVHIQARRESTDVVLFGRPNEIYSTFSGVLLTSHDALPSRNLQAFTVGLTRSTTSHHQSRRVLWNKIYTNIGSGYNQNTGDFTARYTGIYVFSVHALASAREELWLGLYRNSDRICSLYGYDPQGYGAGSNTVTIKLNAGDKVHVLMENKQSDIYVYGTPNEIYGTFTGYMLAKTSVGAAIFG